MNKKAVRKNDKNIALKKISATLGAILIIVFVVYQVVAVYYTDIQTQTANYTEIDETIDIDAWFIRDEILIELDSQGITSFVVDDGEKVAKNDLIAELFFEEETAVIQRRIEDLEKDIENLEKLIQVDNSQSGEAMIIGDQISNQLFNITTIISENKLSELSEARDDLQYLLSKKSIITGSESISDYSNTLNQLVAERDSLLSQVSSYSTIPAPSSGYFISYTDGYEDIIDFETIEDILPVNISEIPSDLIGDENNAKMALGFKWYCVAVIDEQQMIKLEKETAVGIRIDSLDLDYISAEIVSINKSETDDTYALIVSSTYNTPELLSMRNEVVEIVLDEHSGVLVHKDAVYFENVEETVIDENGNETIISHENIKGIYVMYGQRMDFVQIFSEVQFGDYLLCKTSLSESELEALVTSRTVRAYDEVVIKGDDLYDGKYT